MTKEEYVERFLDEMTGRYTILLTCLPPGIKMNNAELAALGQSIRDARMTCRELLGRLFDQAQPAKAAQTIPLNPKARTA